MSKQLSTRAALDTVTDVIRTALDEVERHARARTEAERDVNERAEKCGALRRNLNPADRGAVLEFTIERTALEIASERVPNAEDLPPLLTALRDALLAIPDPLLAFLQPEMDELKLRLDAGLKPHLSDPHARLRAVNEADAVQTLRQIMACSWRTFDAIERPVQTARRLIEELDALVAGKKPWLTT